ncbi:MULTISPECIES: hypothetical protein [Streptomyces]|uniref:Uncharacterized protein n=1 Tax=Streptomyces griseiscabiei TaxID=2993540 RepID=A0ABU4LKC8_9ACTN|nr:MULTISPECIES: hypothetical protein [Streptomyces]MBZ3908586.1 hypothetical protein [Streptomyces griseiscabiei]MDX2916033.1 hypothetical protein [Streptomyces griseiscabiei]
MPVTDPAPSAPVWYREGDDRHVLVHVEDPSYAIDDARFARCGSLLAELAPPLVEGDGRRLCRTCGLGDDELGTTRTSFHRIHA